MLLFLYFFTRLFTRCTRALAFRLPRLCRFVISIFAIGPSATVSFLFSVVWYGWCNVYRTFPQSAADWRQSERWISVKVAQRKLETVPVYRPSELTMTHASRSKINDAVFFAQVKCEMCIRYCDAKCFCMYRFADHCATISTVGRR